MKVVYVILEDSKNDGDRTAEVQAIEKKIQDFMNRVNPAKPKVNLSVCFVNTKDEREYEKIPLQKKKPKKSEIGTNNS